jgi:hypothetical protein
LLDVEDDLVRGTKIGPDFRRNLHPITHGTVSIPR